MKYELSGRAPIDAAISIRDGKTILSWSAKS